MQMVIFHKDCIISGLFSVFELEYHSPPILIVYPPVHRYKSIPDYSQQYIKQVVLLFSSTLYI